MRRTTKNIAALLIALVAAGCGGSNDVALETALAKIEVDERGVAATGVPTTMTTAGEATTTTRPPAATTTSEATTTTSTTAPTTTSIAPAATSSPTTNQLAAAVDAPIWELACALDFGEDPDTDDFRCAPWDRSTGAIMTLPAADLLGCGARLEPGATYEPDVGTHFYIVVMAPEGDGVGEYFDSWYPRFSAPSDDTVVAWFGPGNTRVGGDEFVSGWYSCHTSTYLDGATDEAEKERTSISMSVDRSLSFEDWNPENGFDGVIYFTDG